MGRQGCPPHPSPDVASALARPAAPPPEQLAQPPPPPPPPATATTAGEPGDDGEMSTSADAPPPAALAPELFCTACAVHTRSVVPSGMITVALNDAAAPPRAMPLAPEPPARKMVAWQPPGGAAQAASPSATASDAPIGSGATLGVGVLADVADGGTVDERVVLALTREADADALIDAVKLKDGEDVEFSVALGVCARHGRTSTSTAHAPQRRAGGMPGRAVDTGAAAEKNE